MSRQKQKEQRKKARDQEQEMNEYGFSFIAGYTSGGFTYGITFEEMDENTSEERSLFNSSDFLIMMIYHFEIKSFLKKINLSP